MKEAHQKKDMAAIDTHMATLNQLWQEASQTMYQATEAKDTETAGANGSPKQDAAADGEVTDVDFEEVK